ncbi:MAG: MFS transporter [Acidimicrobiaceae bacterium]|nr:MFS transporter [Acidimicrobiaceae bacterium]
MTERPTVPAGESSEAAPTPSVWWAAGRTGGQPITTSRPDGANGRRATVEVVHEVDCHGLAELRTPRDDLVRELEPDPAPEPTDLRSPAPGETLRFDLAHGPFHTWVRTLAIGPPDTAQPDSDRRRVVETIEYRAAIGVWRPLLALPLRRAVRSRKVPWWAPPDRLDERATRVLCLLACIQIIDGYLGTVITQTITFASDEFQRSATAQGVTLAVTRLGIVVALGVVALADSHGRSRLLTTAAILAVATTALGALSPGLWFLGGTQLVARGLTMGMGILIGVFAAEELPRGSRAYGVSVLALCAALGAGMAVWVLPVADLDPRGWRVIYLVPLLAVPALVGIGRRLPESRRFTANLPDATATGAQGTLRRIEGRRLLLLATAAFLLLVFAAPASQFQNDFLREHRGYSATGITLFTLMTSTPAGIGIFMAGRLADTRGRRGVAAVGLLGGTAFILVAYHSAGAAMWTASVTGTVLGSLTVALGVYGPELFSTRHRARANGLIVTLGVAGSATGLLVVGMLADRFGSYGPAFTVVAVGPVLAAVLVLRWFPETARVELEVLNPGDADLQGASSDAAAPDRT